MVTIKLFLTFQPKGNVSSISQKAECSQCLVHGAETGSTSVTPPQEQTERKKKRGLIFLPVNDLQEYKY